MRTLFIDQSSTCCGFAITEFGELLDEVHGIITSNAKRTVARLLEMLADIQSLIKQYEPNEVVCEGHHLHGLKSSTIIKPMASATFICEAAAELFGIPCYEVKHQTWKSALGARGNKDQIKQDVKRIVCDYWELDPKSIKSFDHSDALGIAAYWRVFAEEVRYEQKGKR